MAIVINGSGTISGVSVGGLPDGIVDTDMIASSVDLGGGKVLQVVQGIYSTHESTTSEVFSASDISASITPSSTSSKILVTINVNGIYNSNASGGVGFQLWKNGSSIHYLTDRMGYGTTYYIGSASWTYLDSPSTTSATTYAVAYRGTGWAVGINNFGLSSNNVTPSSITLMEVAG